VAALNRQQVAAGISTATAVLGLCSCTPSPDPSLTGSGAPTIEQTIEPTGAPTEQPRGQEWVATDNYLAVPVGIAFLSQTDPNYVFSDEPQDAAEQWIFDNGPDQWALGVRAISLLATTPGYTPNDHPNQPAVLVQYINGERYEGTEDMPLGFRGQIEDPESLPTDVYKNEVALIGDPDYKIPAEKAIGEGGLQGLHRGSRWTARRERRR